MYDEEKPKKRGGKKPAQWGLMDIIVGLLGLVMLIGLTIGAFKVAKWVMATYF